MEGTNGKAGISWGETVEYAFMDKKLKIFKKVLTFLK